MAILEEKILQAKNTFQSYYLNYRAYTMAIVFYC